MPETPVDFPPVCKEGGRSTDSEPQGRSAYLCRLCSGSQTVMNLGVGMSFTLSSGRFFNF